MKNYKSLILLVLSLGLAFALDITGLEVVTNVYERETASDQSSDLTMVLLNKRGESRVREIKQFLKDDGDKEKKIMFFVSPSDVKNTSFLNISYKDKDQPDDQWIYLPALRRIKRISSESASDSFMGSDFTYDDLGDRHPEEDTHKIIRTENYRGEDCYVVESIPKGEDNVYSRTITWIIKDKWIGLKKEFYDEDGEMLKRLDNESYKKIKDYWIIMKSTMKNLQSNHQTMITLDNVKLDQGISDQQFTERMMKRGL